MSVSERQTIVHAAAPAPFGGLEEVVVSLALGQLDAGHDVRAVVLLDRGAHPPTMVTALRDAGVPVAAAEFAGRDYGQQRAFIRDQARSAGVLHTHGYRPDVLAGLLPPRFGPARVATVHGFTGGSLRNRTYEWLQVQAYRRYDAIVSVSRILTQQLGAAGVSTDRLHTLANAWSPSRQPLSPTDARRALDIPDGVLSIGWVGRLSHEKSPDQFIRALARLDRSFRATVVGGGRERVAAEQLGTELGVAEKVRWAGVIPNASTLLTAFDMLVISSSTEGTPMVLLEAMSAGVPIVSTAVGGIPDVVSENEAVLVPAGDPAALAAAIDSVAGDVAARQRRADNARTRVRAAYAIPPWVAGYDRIYDAAREAHRSRLAR